MLTRRAFVTRATTLAVATALPACAGVRPIAYPIPAEPPSYDAALKLALDIVGRDAADSSIEREALPHVYTHGKQVQRAVILFHGFTNCPKQFDELARGYYARGCNVWLPRLPLHGLADRLTRALSDLTYEELQACAAQAYWIGRGLGTTVSAVGLSVGGAMALWLAATQPIDLAVPVSPFIAPKGYSLWNASAISHALYAVPDMYWWWDSQLKTQTLPLYAYPGYPTHGLAQLVFFGDVLSAKAASGKPTARNVVLVTNASDNAVNNDLSRGLVQGWIAGGAPYREFVFTDIGAPRHDIIDPTTFPQGRTLVYPTLERIVIES